MSLTATKPDRADDDGPCSDGCVICTTGSHGNGYRPHTLDDTCWCMWSGAERIRSRCHMSFWIQPWTPKR